MLAVFLSGLHWAWWCWATRLQSWGSSAGGPGSGRGTGLGCPLGGLACPFPDRLALYGAEGVRAGHLVGRVLCAGGLVGVGSTVDTGDLRPSGLGGGGSSLWADAWDEALGSMGAPSPCRALGVLLSDSQQDQRVLPWVRMRTASPSPRSGGCEYSHLDPFQTPSEGHSQMALLFLRHPHIM